MRGLLDANRSFLSEMEEVTFWVFEHILGALFGPCQALRMLCLQSPCFYHTSSTVLSTEKKLTTHLTSVMRSQRKTDKSVPIWKLYLDICMYSTHTMLLKQSSECMRVLIFKREKIRRLEYALFLLVLWRLGVETGGHGDPRVPRHLGCSCIKFLLYNNNEDH